MTIIVSLQYIIADLVMTFRLSVITVAGSFDQNYSFTVYLVFHSLPIHHIITLRRGLLLGLDTIGLRLFEQQ